MGVSIVKMNASYRASRRRSTAGVCCWRLGFCDHAVVLVHQLLLIVLSILVLMISQHVVVAFLLSSSTTTTTTTTTTTRSFNHPFRLLRPRHDDCHPPATTRTATTTVVASRLSSLSLLSSSSKREEESSTSTTVSSSSSSSQSLFDELAQRFQGDFDNYSQVIDDRMQGLQPKEGGGHENIHCTLMPISETTRLAAFYFDGNPSAIFRFRYYELRPHIDDKNDDDNDNIILAVDTVLYTLHPDLERQLRQSSDDPLSWPSIFNEFGSGIGEGNANDESDKHENTNDQRIQLLPKCDVRWSWHCDPVLHAYAVEKHNEHITNSDIDDHGIHAVMVYGEALIDSQMMPGQQILIKDQLSLWNDELWIHDRGFNPTTLEYIYGNQRNIPYALERVSNFVPATDTTTSDNNTNGSNNKLDGEKQQQQQQQQQLKRRIVNDNLEWTLGSSYRTTSQYQSKLDGMGGPSIATTTFANKKNNKKT